MKRTVGYFLSVALITMATSCTERQTVAPVSSSDPGSREHRQAEEAALWISGMLLAPDALYAEFDYGFTQIWELYSQQIPEVGIRFLTPWTPGAIDVRLTDEAQAKLRAGESTDIDSLNSIYGPAEIDTTSLHFGYGLVNIRFEKRYHSKRLAETYLQLHSIYRAYPDGQGRANEYGMYTWRTEGGTTYLFRSGWGDCPSGCTMNKYFYFRVVGKDVEYVGSYDTSLDPEPVWWQEARVGLECYRSSMGGDLETDCEPPN